MENIDYLGHAMQPGTLELADLTTEGFCNLKSPRNETGLKLFLRLCNVYRRIVPNLAFKAAPLNGKLKKGEERTFDTLTTKEYEAFATLRNRLVSAQVLA